MLRACLMAMALLLLNAARAQDVPALPCAGADRACLLRAIDTHPTRKLDAWAADRARPLDDRFGPAPPSLVQYLHLDNIANGYPERPRAAVLDAVFVNDVKAAVADLPPSVWQLFAQRLVGVYFVEDLGGTGFTDFVIDGNGKPAAGLIVLDAAVLTRRSANNWATWKENTPFNPQEGWRLDARIQADDQDNRKNAILYILLHELGHVLSIGGNIHPPWDVNPKDLPAGTRYPFFELSWQVDRPRDRYVSLFDGEWPRRTDVRYYFGAKLAAAEMVATYTQLEKTNFPTLYAATRPGDDFAEAFASYVHVVLMQRPWQITISRHGEVLKTFDACWDEPRCAGKRRLLQEMVGAP